MCGDIAVLIPHFQRTPGVLARTLAAVFAQDCSERLTVVIVDDESPVPAAAEFGGLNNAARAAIRLIERKNGGPAAAKNTGLAIIPDSIEYIALLDCDDIWSPGHLSRGMKAMRLGYDLFFCDHRREGSNISQFERCGIDRSQHPLVDSENDLYTWGTDLFDVCLRSSVIGLSTVLFRCSAFPGLRFAEDAGFADDILFALDAAGGTAKVAFTFSEDVFYTAADNASIITEWYSNKSLRVILTLSLCYHKILREYTITEPQRDFLSQRIRETRRDFATTVVGLLFRGRTVELRDFLRFFRNDIALSGELAKIVFKMLRKRLFGQT
jgi:succinoglycan biosynthesis protein ExoW